jgi:hypothetical protein
MATRVKLSENFYLDEFVCPEIYSARGAKAAQLIDIRIVLAVQFLRNTIGKPIRLNTWWNGGNLDERGLRTMDTKTGARWSQHKYGRAADISIEGMTPQQIQSVILQYEEMMITKQWITVLEDVRDTATWCHIDCRYTGADNILIVRA